MPFFSRVFRGKDYSSSKKAAKQTAAEETPAKPKWIDAYQRTEVAAEEVQELLRGCTQELKSRGLDIPFLLLPFRPSSDPSAARTFIRNFFNAAQKGTPVRGEALLQELRLTEPMVLCSVVKWCWSRLPGGVVTWEAYELFKVGEQDSDLARDAFNTFIPISVDSDARTKIIFDFFDLLSAIAAHGKTNGLGGRKLSRYAGWWAFEHNDTGNGFEASYKSWAMAADATSHLFFAYLRSLSPDSVRGINGISALPIALQSLVQATEYPPQVPSLLQFTTTKVVMIVETVSPTPFALLRRAKNFEYRDSDHHLQEFTEYDDPTNALTDECQRVLKAISTTNQSAAVSTTKTSTSLRDASWSRFEDMGFGASIDSDHDDDIEESRAGPLELRSAPQSRTNDFARPTTPSWADFLSSGFADDSTTRGPPSLLLPPDKVLPPIGTVRGQSSQSHKRTLDTEPNLEPGELASITVLDLDDSFWWVWISSLSGEEPAARKAVFGRCALLETVITGAKWLVLEEQVKGAAPEPEEGAYIVEKKRFFGFSTKKKLTRSKTTKGTQPYKTTTSNSTAVASKTSIAPDQHARIQAAAAALQRKQREQEEDQQRAANGRRSRNDDSYSTKTNSVMTQYTGLFTEASSAMKWARHYDTNYDKDQLRSAYLSDTRAGTGAPAESLLSANGQRTLSNISHQSQAEKTPEAEQANKTTTKLPPLPVPPKDAPKPANDVATDAATVPLPGANAAEAETKKETTDDSQKKLKKKPADKSAFMGMFSSTKQRADDTPRKEVGIDPSAVAAARAALEHKVKSQVTLPAQKVHNTGRLTKKSVPGQPPAAATSDKPKTPVATSPTSKATKRSPVSPAVEPAPATSLTYSGPPRTGREAEYDALSRIDTNEKAAAEREFSSFDQGPLSDQPAFVPTDDSPVTPVEERSFPETTPTAETRESMTPTAQPTAVATGQSPDTTSPSFQDRWAQIRKNAAERAARLSSEEIHSRTSQADDGDTSGEETIESRVARIKARVAELTGNMEASR